MCFICGRRNCIPSFHSLEEQQAFSEAEEAYDKFIEVRDKCRQRYDEQQAEEAAVEAGCDDDE